MVIDAAPNAHRGLACPHEEPNAERLLAVARHQATRNTAHFLDRFHGDLSQNGEGLAPVLEGFRDEPGEFDAAFHSSVGQLRVAGGPEWVLAAAANLALHVGERRPAAFSLRLPRPLIFRFAGFELPLASRISFVSDGRTVSLSFEHEGSVTHSTFHLEAGHWRSDTANRLHRVSAPARPVLILSRLPPPLSLPNNLMAGAPADDATRAGYERAYALIEEFASLYTRWVGSGIGALLPLESPPNATCSNSFEFLPGIVALSRQAPPLALAELLVHEASHQYFYLATQLGSVHDGSDTNLYYSPAVRTHRPIDKILIAYHAFANIVLFYRTCREHGFESASGAERVCSDQERFLGPWLDELAKPLAETRALTPLGRALFEPLASRIDAAAPSS